MHRQSSDSLPAPCTLNDKYFISGKYSSVTFIWMLYFRILCWKKTEIEMLILPVHSRSCSKGAAVQSLYKTMSNNSLCTEPPPLLLSGGGVCQRHRLSNNYPSLDLSFSIKKGVFPNTVGGKCPLNRAGLSWGLVIINQQSKIYQTAVIQLLESCIQKLSLEGFVQEATHPPPLFSFLVFTFRNKDDFYHFYYGNVFNWFCDKY